ncbi:phosphopantetheine-binding protein, partial [Streptomyces sp. UH6]|uniref:acyl carrier protein n=1 Tax=Streptomyces sp. UH6 TaxID=2748379 RepID=UPI00280B0B9C
MVSGLPAVAPVRLNLAAFRKAPAVPALLRGLIRTPSRRTAQTGTGRTSALAQRLLTLPTPERTRPLLDTVRAEIAAVLGHDTPDTIPAERAFTELGFDSLTAVELRNRLNTVTGLRLPATLVFDHPNPTLLAHHIETELLPTDTTTPHTTHPTTTTDDEPIAIVGMACRYPGGITNPNDLWNLVATATDGISTFPTNRGWDLD